MSKTAIGLICLTMSIGRWVIKNGVAAMQIDVREVKKYASHQKNDYQLFV